MMALQQPFTRRLCGLAFGQMLLVAMLAAWLGLSWPLVGLAGALVALCVLVPGWVMLLRPWSRGQQQARTLFHSVTDGVLIIGADDRILACNQAFEGMFDLAELDLLGTPVHGWVDIGRAERVQGRVLKQVGATGKALYLEVEQGPMRSSNGGQQRYVFVRDVTRRVQAEHHRRVLRTCVAHIEDMILIADIPPGEGARIRFVNESVSRTMGYAPEQLTGRDPEVFAGPATDAADLEEVRQAIRERTPGRVVLLTYRASGEPLWCEWSIAPLVFQEDDEALFIAVVRDVSLHKRREDTLQRLNAALNEVREDERKRIARDLHDELGQILSAIKLDAAFLKRQSVPAACRERLDSLSDSASAAISQVRGIATQLRPSVLDDLGFVAAARWLIDQTRQRLAIRVDWDEPPASTDDALPPVIATVLYRFLQEALTNVGRHARASRVRVGYRRDMHGVELAIRDDGRGFDPATLASGHHLGLVGMRERVESLTGRFELSSAPGRGCVVSAFLPVTPHPGEPA